MHRQHRPVHDRLEPRVQTRRVGLARHVLDLGLGLADEVVPALRVGDARVGHKGVQPAPALPDGEGRGLLLVRRHVALDKQDLVARRVESAGRFLSALCLAG